MRKLLVPVELRIRIPHQPVQRLVAGDSIMLSTTATCHYDNTSVCKLAFSVNTPCQNTYNYDIILAMTHWESINEIGLDNYGIVTTDDARGICNVSIELPRWVKTGRLEKLGRGVYRLSQYTPSEYDQYAEAVALVGKESMIYGMSVLAMHNLALVNPAKVLVATNARKRRQLPDWIKVVRPTREVRREDFNGIRCQGVADAIRTCSSALMRDRLVSAIIDAKRSGLIDHKDAQELEKEFTV